MSRITRDDLAGAAGTLGLDVPAPGGRYRRTFRFEIPMPGAPQRVEIAADSVVTLAFAARSFDAKAAGAPEAAQLTSGGAGLVLRLPVARQIARVRLTATEAGDQVAAFRFDGAAVSAAAVAVAAHGSDGALLNVTDSQLILRRRRGGSDLALTPAAIAAVVLSVPAQNPRLGLQIVGAPEGVTFLAPETGPGGEPVFPATVARGADFAAALTGAIARFAAGLGGPPPDPLPVELVVEADTPCLVTVTAFDLGYVLERARLPAGAEKLVLRFPGGRRESREVALEGLGGVDVLAATLRLTPAARGAPARAARMAAEIPGPDPSGASDTGIGVRAGEALATRRVLMAAEAVTAAGIAAGAAEAGAAEAVLAIYAEAAGLPGASLGESAPLRLRAGRPGLVGALFEPPVVLAAGPVWIALRVRRGRAVAALVADPGGRIVLGDGARWLGVGAAEGLGAALRLRAPERAEPEGAARSQITVSVGAEAVPLAAAGADLIADLAALPGGLPAGPFTLSVEAAAAGPVTVGPLVLRYVPAA